MVYLRDKKREITMGFLKTELVIKGKRVKHTKYVNSILSIQLPILNSQYFIS